MGKFAPGESGNKAGRPPGSSNRVPSNAEIKKSIKRGSVKALNKLIKLLEDGNSDVQLKSAIKILDVAYEIVQEEEKQKSTKAMPRRTESDYSVEKKDDKKVLKLPPRG